MQVLGAVLFFILILGMVAAVFARWAYRMNAEINKMKEINGMQIKAIINILDEVQTQLTGIKESLRNLSETMSDDKRFEHPSEAPRKEDQSNSLKDQDGIISRPPKYRRLLH
ncbi:MAG: hypothetical protein KBA28_12985 [Syntrophaceae bacterium]|nr:hypothetical protein [Syntrophaceae bacterium]